MALLASERAEVFIVSDMRPHAKAVRFCYDNGYKNANRNTVVFRVRLPKGKREQFDALSGLRLTPPPKRNGA